MRIDRLRQNYNVNVKWMFFPLHPETPADGATLEELFAGRNIDIDAMYARMKKLMDEEGLPYGQRTHTYNSRLAQELAVWADSIPGFEALHDKLYRAYFVDRQNIGTIDVLVDLAGSVGLDVDAAREVLEQRTHKDEISAHWEQARSYGVTGVPTFVAGGYGVVGAQPYEHLSGLLEQVGASERASA